MIKPTANPERTIIGPIFNRCRQLIFSTGPIPLLMTPDQVVSSSTRRTGDMIVFSSVEFRETSILVTIPKMITANTATPSLESARPGVKIVKVINIVSMLRFGELCVMPRTASGLAPRLPRALDTGTMHAEQRFMNGPMIAPLMEPLMPISVSGCRAVFGNRNTSMIPATRNANIIPRDTSFK